MSMLALRERAEENLVAFLPNYLRALAALVVLLAALGGRPLSLVGLACLAAFAVANARGLFGGPSVAETIARKQQQLTAEARNVFNANLDLSPGLVTVQPLQVNYTPPVGTTPDTVT